MLKPAELKTYKYKDLAQMAKQRGIAGWHAMRKEQLINALASSMVRAASSSQRRTTSTPTAASTKSQRSQIPAGKTTTSAAALRKIQAAQSRREQRRDLATPPIRSADGASPQAVVKDRIVLMVRDPYWLHAYWEIREQSIERAQVALAEKWHSARPVLRLVRVGATTDEIIRIIKIHGSVSNWYIDIDQPSGDLRVEIGYLITGGEFFMLARSNVVTAPQPGGPEMIDGNWADVVDNPDRIYAMSGGFDQTAATGELQELLEERLRRPIGSPMVTRFGCGAEAALNNPRRLKFKIDAEMIVYGVVDPDAYVTMGGEPIELGNDGSFSARVTLPDKRQVIPFVAGRSDGVEQQTIILAIERNTKIMEPITREIGG